MSEGPTVEIVVKLLAKGMPEAAALALVAESIGVAAADQMMKEAHERIVAAANYNRDLLIGKSILAAESIYEESTKAGDYKTALAAKKELSKLTRLYEKPAPVEKPDDGLEGPELAAIREHLEPLGLAPPGYPLPELARIAAERIRAHAPQGQ